MPLASSRPLALARCLQSIVQSRSALVSSSLNNSSQSICALSTSAARSAKGKNDDEKKKTSTTSTTPEPKKEKNKKSSAPDAKEEIGGPKGPEPTRYNDWERKGRVSDF